MDNDDDETVHRLEASAPQTGGLVVKKKDSSAGTFKVPKPSLLGLDRLAAQKRKEREDAKRLISFKDSEYDDKGGSSLGESSTVRTPDVSSVHKLSRQYREPRIETPSYSGGVSEKARDRLAERSEKDKRGVYISSKEKKRGQDDDDDRISSHHRRDRDRDYRDRRDRYRERDRSERYGSRDRSDRSRNIRTPRFKDEPQTPIPHKSLATSSWDDDDERPMKRSSWDFPTPKDGDSKRSEWSTRSSSSSIFRNKKRMEDETPRPTPAHKFNAWANDRKRSGATPMTGKLIEINQFVEMSK